MDRHRARRASSRRRRTSSWRRRSAARRGTKREREPLRRWLPWGSRRTRSADLLSAGQGERVALARVLAAQVRVVLADEPTSRLDASTTVDGRFLADLAHDLGTTVVCATHDPLLIEFADREVRLRDAAWVASS